MKKGKEAKMRAMFWRAMRRALYEDMAAQTLVSKSPHNP